MHRIFGRAVVVFLLLSFLWIPGAARGRAVFTETFTAEGDSGIYTLSISEDTKICGLSLIVTYDAEQLKLLDSHEGEVLSYTISKLNGNNPGKVLLTAITTEPITQAGELLSVSFQILTGDVPTCSVEVVVEECIDFDCNEISYLYSSAEKPNPLYQEPETLPSEEVPVVQPDETKPITEPSVEQEFPKNEGTEVNHPPETETVTPPVDKTEPPGLSEDPAPAESVPAVTAPVSLPTQETEEDREEDEIKDSNQPSQIETEIQSSMEQPKESMGIAPWISIAMIAVVGGIIVYYFVFRRRKE